jgi:hypothetical protein
MQEEGGEREKELSAMVLQLNEVERSHTKQANLIICLVVEIEATSSDDVVFCKFYNNEILSMEGSRYQ